MYAEKIEMSQLSTAESGLETVNGGEECSHGWKVVKDWTMTLTDIDRSLGGGHLLGYFHSTRKSKNKNKLIIMRFPTTAVLVCHQIVCIKATIFLFKLVADFIF